ncbi:TOMM precursor leader peptide-binding protein [Rathayibacter soli]|uniref:TOMM precursor leader peptide-binding protein n=1 Tax=Rathayibacter soli TaxID=3144168 RepID=UPI0027E56258|nr:TOMM precursor leader peptide-binding protein [Glaciibacter superstes]
MSITSEAGPTEGRRFVSAGRSTDTSTDASTDEAWILDPRAVLRVVPGEGVYALRGETAALLRGAAYEYVAPLIDGRRTSDDLVDALSDALPAAQVYFVIEGMRRRGYIVHTASDDELSEQAWWLELGADPATAARGVRRTVQLFATTGVDPAIVDAARAGLLTAGAAVGAAGGVSTIASGQPDLLLVFADDYMDTELADVNRAALAAGVPWLLVWPGARRLWLGPLFRPGDGPCWECLMARRRSHRRVQTFLAALPDADPIVMPIVTTPAAAQLVGRVAALEIVKILGGLSTPAVDGAPPDSAVLTELDIVDWHMQKHVVVRRPQCPACGDPTPIRAVPIRPAADLPHDSDTGGFRTVQAIETFRRYRHHVSPITGAASTLEPLPTPDPDMHVWYSGTNLGLPAKNLMQLKRSLRAATAGKGTTAEQARVGALSEALERYSGMSTGEELRIRGSLRSLGDSAIHPNACMLFSDAQLDDAERLNAQDSWFNFIPAHFDENTVTDWTPLWSLTEEREVLLPTGYLYFRGAREPHSGVFADSNGCAAGNTLTEAILQGTLELIERDSVALWWYNRLRRPGVDLQGMHDPWVDELIANYTARGREVWALDLTSDLGIPTIAAISRRIDHPTERILMAFGAHLDPRLAVLRALTELNQMATTGDDPAGADAGLDRDMETWMTTATVANQPYLLPDPLAPLWRLDDHSSMAGDDLAASVLTCRERLERAGLAMHVLDQTRPDIGLPVVRVVVPGIRPFWSRLAPGRLYDVPVKLGWLDAPIAEADLNPIPMFL